jgi:hypothetical protein
MWEKIVAIFITLLLVITFVGAKVFPFWGDVLIIVAGIATVASIIKSLM